MLEAFYATERGSLEDATINGSFDLHPELVWIDLIAPSQEEQQWVLDAYDQNLTTLKSLEDISSSARFYRDDDGILHISTYFLTNCASDRAGNCAARPNPCLWRWSLWFNGGGC
jgi:magnesium transporter